MSKYVFENLYESLREIADRYDELGWEPWGMAYEILE